MLRKKIVVISAIIIVLIATSFLIGTLFSPSGIGRYNEFMVSQPTFQQNPLEGEAITPVPSPAPEGPDYSQERMIIYNAFISLETTDIEGTLAKLRILTESYDGYVAGSSRSTHGMQETAEIILRIPRDKFQAAVQEIESYGTLLNERTNSEDVTEYYIDLKARLENLQRQEKRLHEILELAKTVEDILNVERELSRVRGEIESLQGQLNYLERSVAMSVVTVHLIEPPPPFTPPGMDWVETFETAITGFFLVLRGLIILIISLIPLAIIGAIIYYIYKRRKKKT